MEDALRLQLSQVRTVVSQYNGVLVTLLAVEKPLVRGLLEEVKAQLQIGLRDIEWGSERAPGYVGHLLQLTTELSTTVQVLKENMSKIQDVLQEWQRTPLIASHWQGKGPLDITDENKRLDETHEKIRAEADEIRELVNASWQAVRPYLPKSASRTYHEDASAEWVGYYKYVREIVALTGKNVILSTLRHVDNPFSVSFSSAVTAKPTTDRSLYRQQTVDRSCTTFRVEWSYG
jgi:hypothetical protein